jgi:hypothetical protein
MDMIGRVVPANLAATAQAFYATVAMGAISAIVTLASRPLYGYLGSAAFWSKDRYVRGSTAGGLGNRPSGQIHDRFLNAAQGGVPRAK